MFSRQASCETFGSIKTPTYDNDGRSLTSLTVRHAVTAWSQSDLSVRSSSLALPPGSTEPCPTRLKPSPIFRRTLTCPGTRPIPRRTRPGTCETPVSRTIGRLQITSDGERSSFNMASIGKHTRRGSICGWNSVALRTKHSLSKVSLSWQPALSSAAKATPLVRSAMPFVPSNCSVPDQVPRCSTRLIYQLLWNRPRDSRRRPRSITPLPRIDRFHYQASGFERVRRVAASVPMKGRPLTGEDQRTEPAYPVCRATAE